MGITERKEREKQELKQHILDAAMALFVELGYEKTSIRNIAERIEYSPGTIYLYFKDKADIFLELHTMAFELLFKHLAVVKEIEDPMERLRTLGQMFLQFAIDNPDLYDLMFILREPMEALGHQCGWEEGFKNYDLLKDTVVEAMDKGLIKKEDPDVISLAAWGLVHGLASLWIRKRFKMLPEEIVKPLILKAADELCNRLRN